MPTIVDTKTLIRRAEEHKKVDHISQGTYGEIQFHQNGEITENVWKGCAISCLATEATISGLMNQEDLDFNKVVINKDENGTYYKINIEGPTLREMLSNQFGLSNKLVYLAECIFEGSDEQYAKDWPLKFSQALCDGMIITDADIDKFWEFHHHERGSEFDYFPEEFRPNAYSDEEWGLWELTDYFDVVDRETGEALLDWINQQFYT